MEAFKSWWAQASSRDQLSVVILAVCAVFFILFQFIYNPISSMRSEQEQRVASQRDAYDRVKALADEWTSYEQGAKQGASRASGIEKTVEASFAKHGLRVSGFDASGRSGIRVRFESVSYESFIAWLHDLEINQGLKMKDVSVAGTPSPGVVSASILIQKNQ